MNDPDVFAYLFPPEGQGRYGAAEAISMPANRSRFLPPRRRDDTIKPARKPQTRGVREATEQPEEVDDLKYLPCQELRFSNPPKTRIGLVAGRSPQADLVLPNLKNVSWYHFALTFDEEMYLVVKDLDSMVGTRVIYDGEEGQRGHGIAWSAHGPSLVKGKVPVIKLVEELQFRLVVPDHDITSLTYRDNVTQFLKGAVPAEDLFSDMHILSRTRTELPTPGGAQPPSAQKPGRIFWKRKLAQGSFAVVSYVWDVTSREEYALKEPLPGAGGDWKREAEIMKGISHVSTMAHTGAFLAVLILSSTQDNIVALRHASFNTGPQLYFEYVPGGSLDGYRSTTPVQRAQVAIQSLDALTYLHDVKLLAHRDIKPANVLVQYWSPGSVHIKLSDFGLSKQSDELRSFCGTAKYLAPEVFCTRLARRRNPVKYDALVDIWSLAVLLVWLECGELPQYLEHYEDSATAWGEAMMEFVRNHQRRHGTNALLSFVLQNMLVFDPENRLPAKKCHKKALWLLSDGEASGEDSSEEYNPSTPRALPANVTSSPNDVGASEASTIRLCPKEDEDNGQSSELSESRVSAPGTMSLVVGLGEQGSGFTDALHTMASSDKAEFGRSGPDTIQQNSVVGNERRGSVAGSEECEDGQQRTDSGSIGPRLHAAIMDSPANAAREDGPGAIAVGPPLQRKRSRPGGDLGSRAAQSSSKLADQEPEDGSNKRSKLSVGET